MNGCNIKGTLLLLFAFILTIVLNSLIPSFYTKYVIITLIGIFDGLYRYSIKKPKQITDEFSDHWIINNKGCIAFFMPLWFFNIGLFILFAYNKI